MISPVITAVFTIAYLVITLLIVRSIKLDVRAICVGAVIIALTLVLSCVMIPLPTGAAITAGSWIPLMLLALVYDHRLTMICGWICGLLAMLLIPAWAPVHWAQFFVEHMVCFSCLGYAGIFGRDKRWKVICGVVLAVFLKFTGHVLSGVIFFSNNAWDGWGAWGYSMAYHISSKVPEGIFTLLILLALPLPYLYKVIHKGGEA